MRSRRDFLWSAALIPGAALLGCQEDTPPGRTGTSFWFSYGGRNRDVLESLVHRFNAEPRSSYVHAVFQGDYYEALAKLRTAVAAGAGPALSHVIGEVIPYLAEAGVLEPLDAYPGATRLGVIPALGQSGSWVGGGDRPLVALPFNRSTPIAYLNGHVFAEAGLAAPRTWDELVRAAHDLTIRRDGVTVRYGFECPISWWFWVALVGQAGGRVVEEDGTISLGGSRGAEALSLWQRLVHVERTMKPPPGRDFNAWEATNQDFLAGRTAMIWTSTAFLKYLEDNAPFPVVTAPLPGFRARAVPTGGTHFVILKGAAESEKRAAWEFLRWMMQTRQTVEWSTRTGYMPVTEQAVRQLEVTGYYAENPNDRVAYDQLDVAMPWPWSTELFRVQREVIQPLLESAVLERRSPTATLDRARKLARSG